MACCCELQNTLDVEVTQDALLDVKIGGSAGVLLQAKSVEVTENGTSVVAPDDGFDGLKSVEINTNVPKRFECGDAYFATPERGRTSISVIGMLQKIDVSCWDTSKVSSMKNIFADCNSLQKLDLSGWDVHNVTTFYQMFVRCYKLQYVDVSSFDTSNAKNMFNVFAECHSLQKVDLSGWDVHNVTTFNQMFIRCNSLRSIIGDKNIADVESGTVSLRGAKYNIQTLWCPLRFSSILALANGLADLTGGTAQTLTISSQSYKNMYNDDDTVPTEDVIAERQARIAAICAAKNWNFAH